MTRVKVIGVAAIVAVVESCPVTVMVYVPLGGFETVVELELLPQAERPKPMASRPITAARLRNLREERPMNPASSNPAKATARGTRLGALFCDVFTGPRRCIGFLPPFAIAALAQSEALVSKLSVVVTALVPVIATDPPPLVS